MIFEYTSGSPGLYYNDCLWKPYHNFRIINYFFIMVYALVTHFMVGLVIERFGSLPGFFRYVRQTIRKSKIQPEEVET